MNLSDEILTAIDAIAKKHFCSRAGAVSWYVRQVESDGSDSTSVSISQHQSASNLQCPDHARARDLLQDRQTDRQEDLFVEQNDFRQLVSEVAQAIRANDWYGMRLPKNDTPESYALRLIRAYPDVVTPEMIQDAAMWVYNNAKKRRGKKHLGGFLTNWARNCRKKRHTQPEPDQESQIDYTAGCDNEF